MLYKVKFIKECLVDKKAFAVNDIAEVDDVTYQELKTQNCISDYTEEPKTDPQTDAIAKMRLLVETVVKELKPETKEHQIIVGEDRLSQDPKGGFIHMGEFAKSVYQAGLPGAMGHPSREVAKLQTWNKATKIYIEEGDPAQGGYSIPAAFMTAILDKARTPNALAPRCWNLTIERSQLEIPALNEVSRVDGMRWGGVLGYWLDEGQEKHLSKPHWAKIQLKLKKLALLSVATDEMLEDSPFAIGQIVTTLMGKEIEFQTSEGIYNGTGVAMPLGFNAPAPATIVVPRTGAGLVVGLDVLNLWAQLYGPSRANAIWLCSQDVEPLLMRANFPGDTPLSEFPVMMPAGGWSVAPYATIFGRPLIACEHSPTLGVQGDIALVDLSQYILASKGSGPKFDTSIHLYFDYDMTAFRAVYRVDGQPWWRTTLTPFNGGAVQSPFLVLGNAVNP